MDRRIEVRVLTPDDRDAWLRMRGELWPDEDEAHEREVAAYLAGERRVADEVLVATVDGLPAGFLELRVRGVVDGSDAEGVPYVEGWYVSPALRALGLGRALVAAAEDWARSRGHDELASDADLDNASSQAAHQALGFEEVGRVVLYLKRLD